MNAKLSTNAEFKVNQFAWIVLFTRNSLNDAFGNLYYCLFKVGLSNILVCSFSFVLMGIALQNITQAFFYSATGASFYSIAV